MKMPKKGRDQRKQVSNVKYQSSLDFAPKQRVAEEQNWSSFKGWCHLPGLSDVEIGKGQLKLGCDFRSTKHSHIKRISANADPH